MSKYASKTFWIDTFDRAVATVAQALVGVLTADVTGLLQVDWAQALSVAGLAGAVAVLTSVAFRGRSDDDLEIHDEDLAELEDMDLSDEIDTRDLTD